MDIKRRTRASRPESTGSKQHQQQHQQVHKLSRLIPFCSSCFGMASGQGQSSHRKLHTTCLKSQRSQTAREKKKSLLLAKTRSSTLGPTGNSKVSRGLVSRCPLVGLLRRQTGGAPVWSGLVCLALSVLSPELLGWGRGRAGGTGGHRARGRQGQALETSDSHAALQARFAQMNSNLFVACFRCTATRYRPTKEGEGGREGRGQRGGRRLVPQQRPPACEPLKPGETQGVRV